ncbi:hypothetical protein GGU45_004348 [Niabella hirudinis]
MKKLKLNFQNIEGAQVLTRDQLKNVLGGSGWGGSGGGCFFTSNCDSGYECVNGVCTDPMGQPGGGSGNEFFTCYCPPPSTKQPTQVSYAFQCVNYCNS